jgi:hypothetical protein
MTAWAGSACLCSALISLALVLSEGRGDACLEHGVLTHLTAVRIRG